MNCLAARLTGPQRIELMDVTVAPRADALLVRNLACGICHSEKTGWLAGPAPGQTAGLGHEPVGEIVEVGAEVAGEWHVGQRVSGYWGPGLQELCVVDPAVALPVPDSLPDHHALGEVLACLITCARGWAHEVGDDLALVGCGFMGVLSMRLVAATAATVIAIDRQPERLAWALRNGATHALAADDQTVAQVRELTDGRMCHVVGEASGVAAGLDLALELTGGFRPVLNAISWYNQEVSLKNLRRLAQGVVWRNPHPAYAPERMAELRLGLAFAARGAWNLDEAVSHRWTLVESQAAYATAMGGTPGYIKGAVTMAAA